MMVDLYRNYADPLTDKTMFEWHKMPLAGDKEIKIIGGYPTDADAMQVVSGPIHKRGRFRGPTIRAHTRGNEALYCMVQRHRA